MDAAVGHTVTHNNAMNARVRLDIAQTKLDVLESQRRLAALELQYEYEMARADPVPTEGRWPLVLAKIEEAFSNVEKHLPKDKRFSITFGNPEWFSQSATSALWKTDIEFQPQVEAFAAKNGLTVTFVQHSFTKLMMAVFGVFRPTTTE